MSGVTCVIHCAKGSTESIIQGTKNILEVALRKGVRRFVHISTTEVYGNVSGKVDETFACQYTGRPYGDSKIEAEKLCQDYQRKGLPLTVVRPPIVYGPFSKDWTMTLAHKIQSGNWGIFKGHGDGICNLVYITDLVSGMLLAARHDCAVGQTFNLNGPEAITWNQYFQRFNAAMGLLPLKVKEKDDTRVRSTMMEPIRSSARFILNHFEVPIRRLSENCRPAKRLMKYIDKSIRTTPRMADLSLYNRDAIYLTTKAQRMLGYKPKYDIDRGLEMTTRWLIHVGLVDGRPRVFP